MPNEYIPAPVLGNDNVSPVINPDARFTIWRMDEIYLGGPGAGKYIPKVQDEVHDIAGDTITRFIVVGINEETMVPILHQENTSVITDPISEHDILFGVGPGTQADTYLCYIDRSVSPYRLTVDARLSVGGSNCHLAKIFKGTNTGDDGIVISGIYNQNGQIISENVPLELVASTILTNHAIKTVTSCNTTAQLLDGEVVTAVFYDTAGFVISKRQMLLVNTSFIRTTDAQRRLVIGISLESPFLSETEQNKIDYPLNVPLNAINLIGVVHYSDGTSLRLSVDGTRFSVSGLDAYAATIVGQQSELVLKYVFGINEVAYGIYTGAEDHISEIYTIETKASDGSYAVKLYPYPVWIDTVVGYRLEWYLYDLNRSISYNVTPQVNINTNVAVYDPKLYGTKQTLSVGVNLRDVNGTYKNFIHVQIVDILFNKPGTGRPDLDQQPNWAINAVSGDQPAYGPDVFAHYYRIAANSFRLRIKGNCTTLNEFLDKHYTPTKALFNPSTETAAPLPTHFVLIAGNNTVEYSINDWNSDIMLSATLFNNATVFLKFFRRTVETDLQLSVAALPLFQTDINGTPL